MMDVSKLNIGNLDDLVSLQDQVLSTLEDPDWLRQNSRDVLKECIEKYTVLGVYHENQLIATACLIDESYLHQYIDLPEDSGVMDMKFVYVDDRFRRHGLALALIAAIEDEFAAENITHVLCTIHEENIASKSLMRYYDFVEDSYIDTMYGPRLLCVKEIKR